MGSRAEPPGAALLQLLDTDLPWTTTATPVTPPRTQDPTTRDAPDLQPVLAQAARLHPDLLTTDLTEALTHRADLRREHQRAYDTHQAARWIQTHERSRGRNLDTGIDNGIDL